MTYPTTVFVPADAHYLHEGGDLDRPPYAGDYEALGELTNANGCYVVIDIGGDQLMVPFDEVEFVGSLRKDFTRLAPKRLRDDDEAALVPCVGDCEPPEPTPMLSKQQRRCLWCRKASLWTIGLMLIAIVLSGIGCLFWHPRLSDYSPSGYGSNPRAEVFWLLVLAWGMIGGFIAWVFWLLATEPKRSARNAAARARRRRPSLDPNVIAAELRAQYGRPPTIEEINALHAIRSRQEWERVAVWAAIAWLWRGNRR